MTTGFHLVCGITESNGDLFRQRWYNPFNRMFGDPILRFHVRRLGAIPSLNMNLLYKQIQQTDTLIYSMSVHVRTYVYIVYIPFHVCTYVYIQYYIYICIYLEWASTYRMGLLPRWFSTCTKFTQIRSSDDPVLHLRSYFLGGQVKLATRLFPKRID